MPERKPTPLQENIQILVGPTRLDCFVDGHPARSIEGVKVSVELAGRPIWERTERTRFASVFLGYAPKPFYERRIRKAKEKANKIAQSVQ